MTLDMDPKIVKLVKESKLNVPFAIPFLRSNRISLKLDKTALYQSYMRKRSFYNLSELFHENTKLRKYTGDIYSVEMFATPGFLVTTSRTFSQRPSKSTIKLPKGNLQLDVNLGDVIKSRRSKRNFTKKSMRLDELSKLLYYSYGITGYFEPTEVYVRGESVTIILPLRASPSGGALYPIDIFLGVLNVRGIKRGIYFYDVETHSLKLLTQDERKLERLISSFPFTPNVLDVNKANVVFILAGVFYRTKTKYGERGYRYVLQDSGHIAQNLYLVGTALGLGVVAVDGFYDDELNELLELDGVEEAVVYTVVVGKIG